MPPDTPARLISRGLWGEVSNKLRRVQFQAGPQQRRLAFFFDGRPDTQDQDSINAIAAEVPAGFPGFGIAEEVVATDPADRVPCRDSWHLAYARKEPSLVR